MVPARLVGVALVVLGLAWLVAVGAGSAHAQRARPNVVLIVADDLGRAELGAYGQRTLRTPALDRLAAGSARFLQAYATAPVCAPSRCSILTGLHAGHCAVSENDEPNQPLSSRDPTLAEVLRAAGYESAMVGKWALGGELDDGTPWNEQSAPWRVGFDDVLAVIDQELAQDHYPEWLWRADAGRAQVLPLPENAESAAGRYAPDLFAARAVEIVRTAREPFFLYFALTLPHRELVMPPDAPPLDASLSDQDAIYAAMVERLDAHVGALLDALEERGIAERTLVVFTSDHGPNEVDGHTGSSFGSSGLLRGRKRDLFEGGLRVPLLVAGPGVVGGVIEQPVSLADLLPTLSSLAGAPLPPGLDGRSLEPLLARTGERPIHPHLFFACNERRGGAEPPTRRAVREGRWKWVLRADGTELLFDLDVDPQEENDVSAAHTDVVARLREIARREETARPRATPPAVRVSLHRVGERSHASLLGATQAESLRADAPTPLLSLAAEDVQDDGELWPQRLQEPAVVATLVDAEMVRAPDGAFVRFARERASRVVVPAHPALAVGAWSLSLHARLRLTSLASEPSREERRWLVHAKPMGLGDVHVTFGVLAQAGDLGCPRDASTRCTGREIALVFGDPRLDPARPTVVVGTLAIEDEEVHDLVVRVDRVRGVVELGLDGRRERVPFLLSEGIGAEAPILIGAHHDVHGRFGQGIDGELYALHLAEGLADDDELSRLEDLGAVRMLAADLGMLELGEEATVELAIESLPRPWAHWLETRVELDSSAPASIEGTLAPVLYAGERTSARLRVDTTRPGPVEVGLVVHALRGRTGALVEGAPVRVRLVAHVGARATSPARHGGLPAFARGLLVALVLVVAVVAALASRDRRRVSGRGR
ncbi:MAG: hypothetical protein OHK0013_14000 [Sandaracinaceae bacterium]